MYCIKPLYAGAYLFGVCVLYPKAGWRRVMCSVTYYISPGKGDIMLSKEKHRNLVTNWDLRLAQIVPRHPGLRLGFRVVLSTGHVGPRARAEASCALAQEFS